MTPDSYSYLEENKQRKGRKVRKVYNTDHLETREQKMKSQMYARKKVEEGDPLFERYMHPRHAPHH